MNQQIQKLAECIFAGGLLNEKQAAGLLELADSDFSDLLYWADRIREHYFGRNIRLCSIIPGKLGGCDQDCKFCAQSARYRTGIGRAHLTCEEEILTAAKQTKAAGIKRFGIVCSGKRLNEKELELIESAVGKIKGSFGLEVCVSLGIVSSKQACRLAGAGVTRYNHNLETSAAHFPSIVTTHTYASRVETIRAVKQAGLKVCAGGIFGIGETDRDRVQMALTLRQLQADSVPMNFLHPVEGTPLAGMKALTPARILRIIAIYRFLLPRTDLKIAGGRVHNLRDLQSWIFYAGASSILTGNYLTTAGRPVAEDMQMLADLGLEPV